MKYRFLTVPVHDGATAEDELNQFLGQKRIFGVEKYFVADGFNSYWAFCLQYLEQNQKKQEINSSRIDYREVLSEPDFAVFARLRTLRKELARENGIPAYAIFTNEQLAEMIRKRMKSLSQLTAIEGVGEVRVERYGATFLQVIQEQFKSKQVE